MADAPPTDPVAELIDIPLPAPVSLWPQTWESRIALLVLAAGMIAGTWWLVHRWRANRYRRAALAELRRIATSQDSPADTAAALAALVRRTALGAFPRREVASLSGPAWLAFLDRSYGGTGFSRGAGQSLEAAAYQPTPPAAPQERALIALVRQWVEAHHD